MGKHFWHCSIWDVSGDGDGMGLTKWRSKTCVPKVKKTFQCSLTFPHDSVCQTFYKIMSAVCLLLFFRDRILALRLRENSDCTGKASGKVAATQLARIAAAQFAAINLSIAALILRRRTSLTHGQK